MTTYKLFAENGRLRGCETITLNSNFAYLNYNWRRNKGSGIKDVFIYRDGSKSSKFKINLSAED